MNDKIIIIDDEGKEHTYTNFQDFVNYADSFHMSFLPDNFSYRIEEEEWWVNLKNYKNSMKICLRLIF